MMFIPSLCQYLFTASFPFLSRSQCWVYRLAFLASPYGWLNGWPDLLDKVGGALHSQMSTACGWTWFGPCPAHSHGQHWSVAWVRCSSSSYWTTAARQVSYKLHLQEQPCFLLSALRFELWGKSFYYKLEMVLTIFVIIVKHYLFDP